MSGVWVFGYGSLVSPDSFGHTLGRRPRLGADFFEAEIAGYGRRWNYGSLRYTGRSTDSAGTMREWAIVALGVTPAADETVNGTVGWVSNEELLGLDRRERHYDRVDVTVLTTVHGGPEIDGPIVTYVPRTEAVEHYAQARDRGEAAVDRRYFDLVDRAFSDLGEDRRERYHATTPAPEIPILALEREIEPQRYRTAERE
jgi:cation transport regulator ChaC